MMRGKMKRGEKKEEGSVGSAYRLGVQEGRMMPLTLLFLPSLWTEVKHRWMQGTKEKDRKRQNADTDGFWLERENEARRTAKEDVKGKKKQEKSPCVAFLCLPWRGSFILVSQRAVDSPKH